MKHTHTKWRIVLLITLILTLTACGGAAEPPPTEIDPVAIFTSAAATVAAQLTETAVSFSPTPEPATEIPTALPTATLINLNVTPLINLEATPIGTALTLIPGAPTLIPTLTPVKLLTTPSGPICDEMTYGSPVDVNYPDGSTVKAGYNFDKIWRVYNTGVCTWDEGYILIPVGSTSTRSGDNTPLDAANPAWEAKTKVEPGGVVDIGVRLTAPLANGEYSTTFILRNDRGVNFGGPLTVIIVVKGD
ncbi:MAG: hypothetical protein HQ525_03950 [Anaerolineae bacterium]|nr:hypothetical protein [Anaerolineae bacterium]